MRPRVIQKWDGYGVYNCWFHGVTYPANLANSDPHVSFDKIISFQDMITLRSEIKERKNKIFKTVNDS